MDRRARVVAAGAFLAGLLGACAAMGPAARPPPLDGTSWVLSSIEGAPTGAGAAATLRFEAGRVAGSDGCNRYTAPYTEDGASLRIGPGIASTKRACPPAVAAPAEAFLAALDRTRGRRVEGDRLLLVGADGAVLAALGAEARDLPGTSWRVTGYHDGRSAVVSPLAGTTLTLAFSAEGQASGSAGCNRYTAAYRAEGEVLRFGPAAATRRACAAPAGVMEQEQRFLEALGSVATARREGDRLELRRADGALAATLAREPGE